jgi:ribosomal protein S27E
VSESLTSEESHAVIRTRNPEEPTSRERDLFAQYGPCPECGEETITYSKDFEESDLTCYTCGHWMDYHEVANREADHDADAETGTTGLVDLVSRLRSLF